VHAAGPYQDLAPSVLDVALETRTPYVDLADDGGFVRRAEASIAAAGPRASTVVLGMSFVPGLCAVLVAHAHRELGGAIERVRCVASPGSRGSRGYATVASLLSSAGRPFDVPRGERVERAWGWSDPRRFEFPPPLGARHAYLAIPVADFDLLPRWFGCREVEFRACSDQPLLDRALWIAAGLQRLVPVPVLRASARPMVELVRIAGMFGTSAGGGLIEAVGPSGRVRIAVVARQHAERLPSLPAAFAAADLFDGRTPVAVGAAAPHQVLTTASLCKWLDERGIESWIDTDGEWRRLSFEAPAAPTA